MGKILGLLLIAIASALLIYWIVVPSLVPTLNRQMPQASAPAGVPGQSPASSLPGIPQSNIPAAEPSAQTSLAPPRTPEQQAVDDLEAKRKPYYDWVWHTAGGLVAEVAPADDDRSTLVIYTRQDTPDIVTTLARDVVFPYAFQYGFRHIRFFIPNPPDMVERYRFDSEANRGDDNKWNLFKK